MGLQAISAGSVANIRDSAPYESIRPDDPAGQSAASSFLASSDDAVQTAVEKVNKSLNNSALEVKYVKQDRSSIIAIQLIDSKTKEVLRQMPSEEFFELRDKLPTIAGVLFDRKG